LDIELDQFQKDLLESVREMNEHRALPIAEGRPLTKERINSHMSLSATRSNNVSQKVKKSDTLQSGLHQKGLNPTEIEACDNY